MSDHHSGLTTGDVWDKLVALVEAWERRTAATYLHSDLQATVDRLNEAADRAVEDMARSMFEGLDRALSRGDDAAEQNQRLRDDG